MRLLLLGGTAEAGRLAHRLASVPTVDALVSLAGRTAEPAPLAVALRSGGFGGADGLARFLRDSRIEAVVDATHPFATRISANAAQACDVLGVPRLVFTRPPWTPDAGDRWTAVLDLPSAVKALGEAPRRVFVTTGRLGLAAYREAPQHDYLVRTIDPPAGEDLPPQARLRMQRPPYRLQDELVLLRDERIEVLVTKNSGGAAAKLAAARALALPVVMVDRPPPPPGPCVVDLDAALGWIADHGRGRP